MNPTIVSNMKPYKDKWLTIDEVQAYYPELSRYSIQQFRYKNPTLTSVVKVVNHIIYLNITYLVAYHNSRLSIQDTVTNYVYDCMLSDTPIRVLCNSVHTDKNKSHSLEVFISTRLFSLPESSLLKLSVSKHLTTLFNHIKDQT